MLTLYSLLMSELDDELQAQQGLPLTSYDVLVHLGEAPGARLRMSDLAERILLSKSGLSRVVDVLERQGFVERERAEQDGRGTYATLTRQGKAKLRAAQRAHVQGVRARFLDQLTPEQLESLAAAWRSAARRTPARSATAPVNWC